MSLHTDLPMEFSAVVLALCWLGLNAILVAGKKGAERSTKAQDSKSHVGFLLQIAGYAVCFMYSRTYFSPIARMPAAAEAALAGIIALIGVASIWFCFAAARALGRQWALVARVIDGHELIQQGPYAVVRNPIYLAMLGMLVATGLTISTWRALAVASIVFMIGTAIRIRSEENLLRQALGPQFTDYSRRVPAFFPRLF